jgi:hypothetical protein
MRIWHLLGRGFLRAEYLPCLYIPEEPSLRFRYGDTWFEPAWAVHGQRDYERQPIRRRQF